jgi:hypothetical protein
LVSSEDGGQVLIEKKEKKSKKRAKRALDNQEEISHFPPFISDIYIYLGDKKKKNSAFFWFSHGLYCV